MSPIKIVHILPSLSYGGIARMLYSFYEKINRSEFQFYFIHFGKTEDYHQKILEMGGKIISVPSMHDSGFWGFQKNIKNVLKSQCADAQIIHIHLNYMSGLIAKLAKDVGFSHRICHIRGVLIEGKKQYFLPIYQYLIKKYCTDLWAVSRESGNFYYGKSTNFTILNNGLDYKLFHSYDLEEIEKIKRKYNLTGNNFIITQVGRLSHEKNHLFSLSLIEKLKKEGLPVVLIVAGEGEERENILSRAEELGILDCVFLLGNRNDIQNIYYLSDVTILPSISEGMPNVVLQSQCVGRNCIASDVITKDVDLGLGLVHFCRLNDLKEWEMCLRDLFFSNRTTVSEEIIYEGLKKRGFLLEEEVKKMEHLYKSMLS